MADWLAELAQGGGVGQQLRDAAGHSLADRQASAAAVGIPSWSDHMTTGRLHSERMDKALGGYNGIAGLLRTDGPGITVEKSIFEKYEKKLKKEFGDTIETIPGKMEDGTQVFHLRKPPPVW